MICSTDAGSIPARSTTASCTLASRCAGWKALSVPFWGLPLPIGVRRASTMTASRMLAPSGHVAEDHAARRHADAAGDQHVLVLLRLVHGRATDQADALVHAVDAVDVRLAQLPAVGVGRQPAADL